MWLKSINDNNSTDHTHIHTHTHTHIHTHTCTHTHTHTQHWFGDLRVWFLLCSRGDSWSYFKSLVSGKSCFRPLSENRYWALLRILLRMASIMDSIRA